VTFFATNSAGLCRIVWAFGSTVTFLLAVTAGAGEETLDSLVGAVCLVMTGKSQYLG
jgi:hypothetical protein